MTFAPLSLPSIRRAVPADAAQLSAVATATFSDTFAADNDPRDMAEYRAGAFSEPRQRAELEDPRTVVLLAERRGDAVGYAMPGVREHNVRALAFYRRRGFRDVGSHHFQLGRDRQVDRVITRPVAGVA